MPFKKIGNGQVHVYRYYTLVFKDPWHKGCDNCLRMHKICYEMQEAQLRSSHCDPDFEPKIFKPRVSKTWSGILSLSNPEVILTSTLLLLTLHASLLDTGTLVLIKKWWFCSLVLLSHVNAHEENMTLAIYSFKMLHTTSRKWKIKQSISGWYPFDPGGWMKHQSLTW